MDTPRKSTTELLGLPARVLARAVIGGTISEITGGKFANGATTAAFSQLFNEEPTLARERSEIAQKGNAEKAYNALESTLRQRAADNPDAVLALSVDELKVVLEWTG